MNSAARGGVVIVFSKAPRIGFGKSRLAREAGRVAAWRINRGLHRVTLALARDPRWRFQWRVTPDAAAAAALPGLWPPAGLRRPQGPGDLGARLARAFQAAGPGPAVVIGCDCPAIRRAHLAAAFAALRRSRFVVGPAADGGFWLFGARRPREAAPAFAGVRWSSAETLADLLARLPSPAARLATLRDIDTLADWRAWVQRGGARSCGA